MYFNLPYELKEKIINRIKWFTCEELLMIILSDSDYLPMYEDIFELLKNGKYVKPYPTSNLTSYDHELYRYQCYVRPDESILMKDKSELGDFQCYYQYYKCISKSGNHINDKIKITDIKIYQKDQEQEFILVSDARHIQNHLIHHHLTCDICGPILLGDGIDINKTFLIIGNIVYDMNLNDKTRLQVNIVHQFNETTFLGYYRGNYQDEGVIPYGNLEYIIIKKDDLIEFMKPKPIGQFIGLMMLNNPNTDNWALKYMKTENILHNLYKYSKNYIICYYNDLDKPFGKLLDEKIIIHIDNFPPKPKPKSNLYLGGKEEDEDKNIKNDLYHDLELQKAKLLQEFPELCAFNKEEYEKYQKFDQYFNKYDYKTYCELDEI